MESAHFQSGETLLLQAALAYAMCGWRVFPCHTPTDGGCSCGKPSCENIGKHPRVNDWPHVATTDEATIQGWWSRWPHANIGIATGAGSGLVVLDVDPDKGGSLALEDLLTEHGRLPETVESQTGGGGRHIVFQHPSIELKTARPRWEQVSISVGMAATLSRPRACIRADAVMSGKSPLTPRTSHWLPCRHGCSR
jgi:hypothetical protein